MEQPTGFVLAVDAVTRHVNSARPDAPVRPERPRVARLAPTRLAAAGVLRRLADRIQPPPVAAAPRCS
ncbi:hypothetical protein DER29_3029 [Micromonospora sp. M71_S20]|uniref:hypothetical protein n=1 Tax=unclassified Micromonospora TaxID=2617518 RepID=UPI000EB0180A|nr:MULTISPECIES: hypothetical protein [unclassified Micromonospora]KAB1139295.1 hypothetical protein F6X68_23975 [Micromonospora sp. AMSO12t]RLK25044.1 hypothetical protein DER29_3029 [Micromonospora sp. M71_S20]